MSDAQQRPTAAGGAEGSDATAGEPVGSVAEEAAKLFGALTDWARDQGEVHRADHRPDDLAEDGPEDPTGRGEGPGQAMGDAARQAREQLASGGDECRWCPLCQAVAVARQTSPEVRTHLVAAAGSLARAAAALLATTPPGEARPVQKIDLDDESVWDEQDGEPER